MLAQSNWPAGNHQSREGHLDRYAWRRGVQQSRRPLWMETWTEIRAAYASGIGLREIARNMGLPAGTVLAHAKRELWTRQIESSKALAKREDTLLAVTPVEAVAMSMQQRGERHIERMAGVSERGVDHIETMDGPEILNPLIESTSSTSSDGERSDWMIVRRRISNRSSTFKS